MAQDQQDDCTYTEIMAKTVSKNVTSIHIENLSITLLILFICTCVY